MVISRTQKLSPSSAETNQQAAKTTDSRPAKKLYTKNDAERNNNNQKYEVYQIELEEQNTELHRVQEELEAQQIELELQNDELRSAQEQLELSRNKYAELYDFAPVGYFSFDTAGNILEVNLTGAQLLGIVRSQLTNRPFSSFIVDADGRELFKHHLDAVMQQQVMQRCEFRLSGKDGSVIHGQLQSVSVDTALNGKGYILSSLVDGTLGKRLEAEIQDAREYAESIVDTVHKPLVVLDSNLKILTANPSFYDTFLVTPEETIGHFIYDLGNRQWDIPKLRVLFEDILPHETVFNGYEVEHDFPGIGHRIILLNAREIFRKEIGSHIILLAMEDITERKKNEAEKALLDQELQTRNIELQMAKVAAEKANLAKSDFLSSMSHELRTPLSAVLGFAQIIESGTPEPTPAQKRSLDQILKAGWYLLELINEVLDLAQIESGKLSLSLEPVSLAEVMRECEAMVEPQATKCGITITFKSLDKSCVVKADRTRVKQILINLLTNAIKYNRPEGTVVVEGVVTPANSIRISVSDSGAGLSPEQITQLFQPFNRLGQEATVEEGTGIGLVVCKRLVEWMGGTIGVESIIDRGSVFWFELNLTSDTQASALNEQLLASSGIIEPGQTQLQTLLYVEDNPANLMLVEDIIARKPEIRLLSARDASRGVELARASLPDVILMDINLPGISGVDALKILAMDKTTARIPVIALSANAMPRDISKGLEAGFFRYLTKPIKIIEFMDTLDVAMKFSKAEARTKQQRNNHDA